MKNSVPRPFLKWAGGKRQLLEQFEDQYPEILKQDQIDIYIEPFVGGGAVFFDLINRYNFSRVVLNDVNEKLMLTYRIVKKNVEPLINILQDLETKYLPLELEDRKEIYYNIRDRYNSLNKEHDFSKTDDKAVKIAAYLIFLNRTCFNGLYRENQKGEFNVPIGRYKKPTICDEENLRSVSAALADVNLTSKDFARTEKFVDEKAFVYIDPPYRPLPGTKSFKDYSKSDFNEASQKRLADWYASLDKKHNNGSNTDVYLMLSNSNPKNTEPEDDFFEKLYGDFNIEEVEAKRSINSKASGRGKLSELLIKNYKD